MSPVQKRALLAILCMIESGIQQMKSLIAVDGGDDHATLIKQQPPSSSNEYLADSEEEMLDKMMEEDRQRLHRAEAARMESLWELDT